MTRRLVCLENDPMKKKNQNNKDALWQVHTKRKKWSSDCAIYDPYYYGESGKTHLLVNNDKFELYLYASLH